MTTDRTPAGNSTYKKLAVSCPEDSFVVAESFVLRINISSKSRQLLVAAKRYTQLLDPVRAMTIGVK